jgi:hypoxanthine phosphoribosyltransferase
MKIYNFIKKIIYTEQEIEKAITFMAHDIDHYYRNIDEVIVLIVMNGAEVFARHLFNNVVFNSKYENKFKRHYIHAKSYKNNIQQEISISSLNVLGSNKTLSNKAILIIDDIYDSGRTLDKITKELIKLGAEKYRIDYAVLLERNKHLIKMGIQFEGLQIDTSDFLVGFGLDYNGEFRSLPYIASVKNGKDEYWNHKDKKIRELDLCNKCGKEKDGLTNINIKKESHSVVFDKNENIVYDFDMCEECLNKLIGSLKNLKSEK